jgi:hypothetical protein
MTVTNIADVRARKFEEDIAKLKKLATTADSLVTRNAINSLIKAYRLLGTLPEVPPEESP